MEILASRDVLAPVLTRVAGVVERKQTLPILGNLLLRASQEGLTVVGTDMEVEIRASLPAEVVQPGEITVPARKLADICRTLPEGTQVRLKVSGERCLLTAGRGRYVLGSLPAQDFPSVDAEGGARQVVLDELALKRLLEKTSFAMAQQDVRYYLNGLFLQVTPGSVKAVATDGHRLACFEYAVETGLEAEVGVIVPHKTVTELKRQLGTGAVPVALEIGERSIRLEWADTTMTSKLVDGRYPDYQRVIPGVLERTARADKEGLRRALSRTAILSNEKYRGVRVTFEPGALRLQAHNPEQEEAVEEMELAYDGEPTTIGFNVAYLTDVLGAIDGEEVEVCFQDGNSSSIWRGAGCMAETYVVMPMRL